VSSHNLEVVRSIYRALADGASTEHCIHEDAEYVNPPYAVEPGTRPWAVAMQRLREIYADFHVEPEEYMETGEDQVVVIVTARASGASGVETSQRLAHVWTIRDDKASRFRWFSERDEEFAALSAGGGERWPGSDPATGLRGRSASA